MVQDLGTNAFTSLSHLILSKTLSGRLHGGVGEGKSGTQIYIHTGTQYTETHRTVGWGKETWGQEEVCVAQNCESSPASSHIISQLPLQLSVAM